jgi:diguanylate cyclase (GGDEF)-like protein
LAFADRLRTAIETTPLADGSPPLHRTASIGLASLRSGESLDSLLDRADKGLRLAKSEGRNRVVVMEPLAVRDDEGLAGSAG